MNRRIIKKAVCYTPAALLSAALILLYLYPADPALTSDSMEYLARRYTHPLHPHHLLWVYLLHAGSYIVRCCTSVDIVRAAQIFQAVVSACGVFLFGLLLRKRGQLAPGACLAWAGLFGVSAGYACLAQEAEAYNTAICFYLASILVLPAEAESWDFTNKLRYGAALGLFVLSVCTHQLFALAAIPLVFYYWAPGRPIPTRALTFCAAAGVLTLLVYVAAYAVQPFKNGFVDWITLYSGRMPLFGQIKHLTTPYYVHRLVANLMAATVYDPVPLIKAASEAGTAVPLLGKVLMLTGYCGWAIVGLAAVAGMFSPNRLYRFFAAWYLVFESFLWYWAPWLLQMQVLAMPAVIGVVACASGALLQRLRSQNLRWAAAALPLVLLVIVLGITRFVHRPRLGSLTMDEAHAFYAIHPIFARDENNLMILYDYGESRPYIIEAGKATIPGIAVIEDGVSALNKQVMRETAIKRAMRTLQAGGNVLIHKSMLLDDPGECGVRNLAVLLDQTSPQGVTSDLLRNADNSPVALRIHAGSSDEQHARDSFFINRQIRKMATDAKLTTAPVLCK